MNLYWLTYGDGDPIVSINTADEYEECLALYADDPRNGLLVLAATEAEAVEWFNTVDTPSYWVTGHHGHHTYSDGGVILAAKVPESGEWPRHNL